MVDNPAEMMPEARDATVNRIMFVPSPAAGQSQPQPQAAISNP